MENFIGCSAPLSVLQYFITNQCAEVYGELTRPWSYGLPAYVFLFLLTLFFETPIYFVFLRTQSSLRKIIGISVAVNLATHPLVCLVFPKIFNHWGSSEGACLINSEIFALTLEALLLWKAFRFSFVRSLSASVTANLFSWLVGGCVLRLMLS